MIKTKILMLIGIILLLSTTFITTALNEECQTIKNIDKKMQGPLMQDGKFYSKIPLKCQNIQRSDFNG